MTLKQYRYAKIAIAMFVAILISQSMVLNSYWLAAATLTIAIGINLLIKNRVKEIIADERDYQIAGQASRYALSIFSVVAAVLSIVFMFLRQVNPVYETIGSTIAYTVCLLMLTYSLIFTYLSQTISRSRKIRLIITSALLIIFFLIGSLRFFSGDEDTWICKNGQWTKHGNPDNPAPQTECR